mmetsp:Transcript_24818/g.46351  ORF Transcript_24818/g.46351 Transcript_24818/m.46351 type:complete len:223 (+) Transcript_24818:170-838(+)
MDSLSTVCSRSLDLHSWSSLTTCVLHFVLLLFPNWTVFRTSSHTTPLVLVRMDLLINLLRLFPVFELSPTWMFTDQLMPKKLLPPWSAPSHERKDLPPSSSLVKTSTKTTTWTTWPVVREHSRELTLPRKRPPTWILSSLPLDLKSNMHSRLPLTCLVLVLSLCLAWKSSNVSLLNTRKKSFLLHAPSELPWKLVSLIHGTSMLARLLVLTSSVCPHLEILS